MENIKLRSVIFMLALSLVGFACNDSSTGPGSDSDPATIDGRVENNGTNKASSAQVSDIEGLVVTAATVNADGSLETISGAEAETNAEGEFSLEVDVEEVANSANHIVVKTEQGGQTIKAFVSQELSKGSKATVQPLTFESTAEANVFAEVVANGDTDLVSQADIEAVITEEMGSELMGDIEAASELATSLAAKTEAQAQFYAAQGVEITEDQIEEVLSTKADAMATLEANLNAAASEEDKKEAVNAFNETVAKAQLEAGVQASAVAKSLELSSRVLVNNNTELSNDAKSELRENVSIMLAYTLDAAIQAQMEAAEASESSVNAVADAAIDLRTELKSMSAASEEDIKAVFTAFNGLVIDILQNEFSANAETFAEVNSTINSSGGAKSELETTLAASVDLSGMISAYSEFYSSAETIVEAAFTTASDTEAEAFTEIMILINVAS